MGELVLENTASGGVGSWFKEGPKAAAGVFCAKGGDRFTKGRGVMAEIIDNGDAFRFSPDFKSTPDSAKLSQNRG